MGRRRVSLIPRRIPINEQNVFITADRQTDWNFVLVSLREFPFQKNDININETRRGQARGKGGRRVDGNGRRGGEEFNKRGGGEVARNERPYS